MRLSDLDPHWLRREDPPGRSIWLDVESIEQAEGIQFLCPKCFRANGGPVGTHSIICWRPAVPQTVEPKPGRWELVGTSFEDLELVAGSSSVLLIGGCCAHFFVRGGAIIDC